MGDIKQIRYDAEQDRLLWGDVDLHCGQGLRVLLWDGVWHSVVIELDWSDRWCISGHPEIDPVGLWARDIAGL